MPQVETLPLQQIISLMSDIKLVSKSSDEKDLDTYKVLLEPHNLGPAFKATIKDSVPVQKELRNVIRELLCNDVETRNSLKGIIRNVQKERVFWILSSFSGMMLNLTIAVLSIIGTLFTIWVTSKLGL